MLQEFREFINRGNVVDLAVAVIMGAAFSAIVNSLVADLVTPAILTPAMNAAGVDKLANLSFHGILYGNFLAAVLNFLVVAFTMFLLVKGINTMQKKKEEEPQEPEFSTEEKLLMEIRDLLKQR
ncbi:MAG TPA: large conductance mechanosensitive channel protein MscL [Caldilineaceae bacterium]|nr:large conductance mechanosensitive channel protein MscL [Caldilineaceae bacterium]